MLHRSGRWAVVFTQGYPHLEAFADRNFLKDHPLRHSPLWLDEFDFHCNAVQAKKWGLPHPLRILPYAHHPLRSPYATLAKGHKKTFASLRASSPPSPAATPYQVPVCTIFLCRPFYVYNQDQMTLGNAREPPASTPAEAPLEWPGEELESEAVASHADSGAAGARPAGSEWCVGTGENEGTRSLRVLLPPCKETGEMRSIRTHLPFSWPVRSQLQEIHARCGYKSTYWGTRYQWMNIGARPRFGESEHIIRCPAKSKLVHISLVEGADAVLRNSYISAKTGQLRCFFSARGGAPDGGGDLASVAMMTGHEGEPRGSSHETIAGGREVDGPGSRSIGVAVTEDMLTNGYALPLYFSSKFLEEQGLSLKEGATGVVTPTPWLTMQLPRAVEFVSSSGEMEAAAAAADMEAAPRSTPWSGSSSRSCQTSLKYLYHLSQVQFPEPFHLSAEVIAAELEHPGVALDGVMGGILAHRELRPEHLSHHYPELAAVVLSSAAAEAHGTVEAGGSPGTGAETPPPSSSSSLSATEANPVPSLAEGNANTDEFARFIEEHASPRLVRGRSLWFTAEDVLQRNGIVDVNAVPVEVTVRVGDSAGCRGLLPPNAIFNVECLKFPDEGLRRVNTCWSSLPHSPSDASSLVEHTD